MSLFWNDKFWYFEKIPKKGARDSNFVLVKKLFVGNIREPLNQKEKLSKLFQRFGKIETVNIFKEKYCNESNANNSAIFYAYLTFTESQSVYLALKDAILKRKYNVLKILPADSWRQPAMKANDCENITTGLDWPAAILELNDHCLLEIFSYMDLDTLISTANTCLRFHHLIDQNIFPRFQSVVFNFDSQPYYRRYGRKPQPDEVNVKQSTLIDMRYKLLAIGPYVKSAKLLFSEFSSAQTQNTERLIELFSQLIGENVESLTVLGLLLTKTMQQHLQPVFRRLKFFEFGSWFCWKEHNIELRRLCPNLVTLKIWQVVALDDSVNRWEKLEHITFGHIRFSQISDYELFLPNNPQLKSIRFMPEDYSIERMFTLFAQHQKVLDTAVLLATGADIHREALIAASRVENLKTFKILYLSPDELNTIIRCLCDIEKLTYLKISIQLSQWTTGGRGISDPPLINHDHMMQLVKSLPRLNKLSFRGCKLLPETISAFIRNSQALEVFDLRQCDVTISRELVQEIYEIRNFFMRKQQMLKLSVDAFSVEEIETFLMRDEVKRVLTVTSKSIMHFVDF